MTGTKGLGNGFQNYRIEGVAGIISKGTNTLAKELNEPSPPNKERVQLNQVSTENTSKKSAHSLRSLLRQNWLAGASPNQNHSVLAAALADGTSNTHHAVVDRYFRNVRDDGGGVNAGQDRLKAAIANAIPYSAYSADPWERAAHMSFLTTALAGAVGTDITNRNPIVAVHVLACLTDMDLAGIIRGDANMPPAPSDLPSGISWDDVQQFAWKTAYALATTKKGYATLQRVANSSYGGINAADVRILKDFLNTAHFKSQEFNQQGITEVNVDPASLMTHASGPANRSLLGDALQGDLMRLNGTHWDDLPIMRAYACGAVRNGFLTDESGSDLDKAMKRANKMIEWEQRAINLYNDPETAKTTTLNLYKPHKSKSPLSALLDAGNVGNLHSHAIGESRAAEFAWHLLRAAYDDVITKISNGLAPFANDDILVNPNQDDKVDLIDCCIKLAILEACGTYRLVRGRQQGRPMQPYEQAHAETLLRQHAVTTSGVVTEDELLDSFNEFTQNSIVLNSKTLDDWANKAHPLWRRKMETESTESSLFNGIGQAEQLDGNAYELEVIAHGGEEPEDLSTTNWTKLHAALDRVRGQIDAPKLKHYVDNGELDFGSLANFMKDVMLGCELGSVLTTTSGYTRGATSKNYLTATLSNLIETAGPSTIAIAPSGHLSYVWGKDAYVNLSLGSTGLSFDFGIQNTWNLTGGGGAFIGHSSPINDGIEGNVDPRITGGGSAMVAASYQGTTKESLVLRKSRDGREERQSEPDPRPPRKPGLDGDMDAKKDFEPIIEAAMIPLTDQEKDEGLTSTLQKVLASDDEVSVTYIDDASEKKIGVSGSLGGAGTVGYGQGILSAGGSLAVKQTWQPENLQVYIENYGTTCVRQETWVEVTTVNLSGGANINGTTPFTNDASRTIGTGSVDIVAANADIFESSRTLKRTIVYTNGDVSPGSTLRIIHKTVHGFVGAVMSQLEAWTDAELKSMVLQMPPDIRPAEGSDEYKAIRPEARESILQFLERLAADPETYMNYTQFYQFNKDKANEINKHWTNSKLAGMAGDVEEAEKEKKIAILMERDPDSWDQVVLYSSKSVSKKSSFGTPNLFGYISTRTRGLDITNLHELT